MSEENTKQTLSPSGDNSDWEKSLIEKLALAGVTEQRRSRRWGIFFKLVMTTYFVVLLVMSMGPRINFGMQGVEKHTAVVDVSGMILEDADANATSIIQGLHAAVEDDMTQGIIIRLNTPGGSPVQSAYVYEEILAIRKQYPDIPVHAVVTDMCTSGGYYIATAVDKIFVNPASIVGSIGVIMEGYGFVNTMEKLGVERRVMTAGKHKAMLDSFAPVNNAEKAHAQHLLDQVHQQFIDAVKSGRGERLKVTEDMFSGLVWTGQESIALGLTDGLGHDRSVAKDIIGAEKLVDFTPRAQLLERLATKIASSVSEIAMGGGRPEWLRL
ncbi:MAG: S49 family peptidase [Methylococcales bacterium]|jgi:protease-4|nr:S49 family peptidase [Methylococcales bacterium]